MYFVGARAARRQQSLQALLIQLDFGNQLSARFTEIGEAGWMDSGMVIWCSPGKRVEVLAMRMKAKSAIWAHKIL